MGELLKELFLRHYQSVYAYLYSLSRDAALSEDLASEVFLEAVKSIYKFRGESDVKTWLFSIARHRWYAHLRRQNREPVKLSLEEAVLGTQNTPESEYIKKEQARRIRALLEQEPERSRTILEMHMEGLSYHEIGIALGISENSARVIAYRLRQKIRTILEKEGF